MAAEIDKLEIKIAADASDASAKITALANSISKLAGTNLNAASTNLSSLSDALGSLKEIKGLSRLSDTLDEIGTAVEKLNGIQVTANVRDIADAFSGLSAIAETMNGFKVNKSFSSSIDAIASQIPKLNELGNIDNSLQLLENVENLAEVTSGLRSISENISNLKVNKSFETNLDNLSSAIQRLNEIGNTSSFASGVSGIEQAIERLNNIEIGQGFVNLLQATSQFESAISDANNFRLGATFNQSIERVAEAAAVLKGIDFSGFARMNDALSSLPDNVRVSFGASSEEVQNLAEHLVNLVETVQSIQSSLPQRRQRGDTNLDINSPERDRALDQEEQAPEPYWLGDATQDIIEQANAWNQEYNEVKQALDAYETLGVKVPPELLKIAEAYGVVESRSSRFKEIAASVGEAMQKAFEKIGQFGTAAFTGVAKGVGAVTKSVFAPLTAIGTKFQSAAKKAGEFLSSIKRIAMYRAIRTAIKAITDGFAEGRKNLYYYSQAVGTDFAPSMDKAATAALYFKNSIGAATAPLTNYLVPMIDRAVDHLVELINKFNELTAALTGASTWTRAIKYPVEWQDSLEDANASAKKLKSTMLGFDELNVIEPNTPSSKSKGFDAEDYAKMFEEVVTSASWRNSVPDVILPIKLAWDAEGDNTIRTIKNTWNEILGLLGSVGESFRTVWTNGTGQQTLELILQITQNIVGTFGALAKKIREAWDEGGKGTAIIQSVWNIANNLLTVFNDIWASIREWAENLDWNPLLGALGDLFDAIDELTNPESGAMALLKGLFDDVLLPLGKWTLEAAAPLAISTLASAIRTLKKICDEAQPVLKELWDTWLKPIAEWVGTKIIDDLTNMKSVLEDIEKIVSGDVTFKDWWKNFWGDLFTDEESRSHKIVENIEMGINPGGYFGKKVADWAGENWDTGAKSMGFNMGAYVIQGFFDGIEAYANHENVLWFVGEFIFGTFISAIKSLFKISSPSKVTKELGGYVSDGFLDGIKEKLSSNKISTWIKTNIFDPFIKGIKNLFDINSPSKVTEEIGGFITDGLLDGIAKKFSITEIVGWIRENVYNPFINGVKSTFGINTDGDSTSGQSIGASVVGGIKSGISGAIGGISSLFTKNEFEGYGTTINEGISDGIKNSYGTTIEATMTERRGWIKGLFNSYEFHGSGSNIVSGIADGVNNNFPSTLWGAVADKEASLKNLFSYDNFYGVGQDIVSGMADGIDENAYKLYNAFHDAIQESDIPEDLLENLVINFKHLNGYASGGIPENGELFVAREAGAEFVGRFGSHTAVANNAQIVQAVSDGVYKAVSAAMAQQNQGDMIIQPRIYLDRQELTSQVEQQQNANGISIFAPVVYT